MKIKKTLRRWADRLLGPSSVALEPIKWTRIPVDGYSARIKGGDEIAVLDAAHRAKSAVWAASGKHEDHKFRMHPENWRKLYNLTIEYAAAAGFHSYMDMLFGIPVVIDREVGPDYVWIVKNPKLYDADSGITEQIALAND